MFYFSLRSPTLPQSPIILTFLLCFVLTSVFQITRYQKTIFLITTSYNSGHKISKDKKTIFFWLLFTFQVTRYQKTDYPFDYYFEQSETIREQGLVVEDSSESDEEDSDDATDDDDTPQQTQEETPKQENTDLPSTSHW